MWIGLYFSISSIYFGFWSVSFFSPFFIFSSFFLFSILFFPFSAMDNERRSSTSFPPCLFSY